MIEKIEEKIMFSGDKEFLVETYFDNLTMKYFVKSKNLNVPIEASTIEDLNSKLYESMNLFQ
jgi:hypothetical protein